MSRSEFEQGFRAQTFFSFPPVTTTSREKVNEFRSESQLFFLYFWIKKEVRIRVKINLEATCVY